MKKIATTLLLGITTLLGCEEKHYISVDRLEAMSKINVLYVSIAEPYRLGTSEGRTMLSRLVRGGAYYSVDLSKAKPSHNEVETGGSVKITLPCPQIEPKPDPTRSVEFNPKTGILVNDQALNRIREMYDEKDREKIASIANKPEYMKMAKEQAEKIIRDMLNGLKVTVEWSD